MVQHRGMTVVWLGLVLVLVTCAQRTPVTQAPEPAPVSPALPNITWPMPDSQTANNTDQAPVDKAKAPEVSAPAPRVISQAKTPKDYRADAAKHLYQTYQHRIYKGKMPPMLKAVGVVEVAVDQRGQVKDIVWLRAPRHVPDVMRDIEAALREAAPYPAPVHLQQVKYIETWLWHASGRFQLDTLTEGQY